eukprot:Pgem_evm1s10024
MLKIKALPGANFRSCAGQAYPGTLVGWAASWNDQGLHSLGFGALGLWGFGAF